MDKNMTGKIKGIGTGTIIFLIIALMLMLTPPALAASAGVSPASIMLNATQGESYTINFAAVNTGDDTTDYSISARGNITNWTQFNITKITLAGKKAYPTDALITIPDDLPDGTYKGDIIIKSIPDSSVSGNKISVAVNLPITLIIERPGLGIELWMVALVIIISFSGLLAVLGLRAITKKRTGGKEKICWDSQQIIEIQKEHEQEQERNKNRFEGVSFEG